MKRVLSICLLFVAAAAGAHHDEVIKRGEKVPNQPAVAIADVLKNPDAYGDEIVVEGVVAKVCKKMGCWMELSPEEGKAGIRVSLEDFTVPKDSAAMSARAVGVVKVKNLSKDEADHLEEDGAKLVRNADGTAREVSFKARGAELKK